MPDPYTGAIAWNNAEGGTDGVTVSIGNSGGASGTAWSDVVITAGTLVYESTGPVHDTMSILMTPSAASNVWRWNNAVVGSLTGGSCGVVYINFTTLPATSTNLVLVQQTDGGSTAYRVQMLSTGFLRLVDSAGTPLTTATGTAMTTGTVYRIEWQVDHGTGDWTVEGFVGDSTTVLQSATGAGASMGTASQQFTFGRSQSPDYTAMWDTLAIDTTKLGPRAVATVVYAMLRPAVVAP